MNVLLKGISKVLKYEEKLIYTVCIQDKTYYRALVYEVYKALEDESDAIKIYNSLDELKPSKTAFILDDIFNPEINSTKINTAVLHHLKDRVYKTNLQIEKDEITSKLTKFFDEVAEVSDYSIGWNNDIDLSSLLKLAGFKVELHESSDILHGVISYMKVLYDLLGIRLFIFINKKTMFEECLLKEFYHQCALEGYCILNLDVDCSKSISEDEKVVILDNDFCEIY